ncbi:PEGA domain-containing protein [Methanoregula sp.]|jgi:hypothetical protein|uniref:PEGA domain-containing protein n=1 Tax=Methanoregula sp. TaxID=2052170 RepID=UPI003C1C960B
MNTLLTARSGKNPVPADIRFYCRDCHGRDVRKYSRDRVILLLLLLLALSCPAVCARSEGGLLVEVSEAGTGSGISGASVYIDGGYAGSTSGDGGAATLTIPDISGGAHTVRVTATGFRPVSANITYPGNSPLPIILAGDHLVALSPERPGSHISVVFIPSSTYYRTADNAKVTTDVYLGNETRFREDVNRVINQTFGSLDQVTDPTVTLPPVFRDRFAFYYYFDPADAADAFSGCAGQVPDSYWETVTFSDLTIILYPHYDGWYLNASYQPVGCFVDSGTGHKQMKVPSDRNFLFLHEIGHGLFGLVDTYCGDTDYFENEPFPNVWSTEAACRDSAVAGHRDPSECRRIQQEYPGADPCIKDFWRWDPDPDIMRTSASGMFGAASAQRIAYILTISAGG